MYFRIDASISSQAVNIVLGFLKDKLPPPLASQVEGALNGQGTGGIANQAASALGDQSSGGMLDQAKGLLGKMIGKEEE